MLNTQEYRQPIGRFKPVVIAPFDISARYVVDSIKARANGRNPWMSFRDGWGTLASDLSTDTAATAATCSGGKRFPVSFVFCPLDVGLLIGLSISWLACNFNYPPSNVRTWFDGSIYLVTSAEGRGDRDGFSRREWNYVTTMWAVNLVFHADDDDRHFFQRLSYCDIIISNSSWSITLFYWVVNFVKA